jgi:hypothetical protein
LDLGEINTEIPFVRKTLASTEAAVAAAKNRPTQAA